MVRLTSLAALATSLPLVFSHPSNPIIHSRDVQGGCGTIKTEQAIADISALSSGSDAEFSELAGFSAKSFRASAAAPEYPWGTLKIKTWIHVIAASNKLEDGYIPDEQVNAQLAVLNEDFAPGNIQFELQGVTRSINASWASETEVTELEYKKILRKGDYSTLNLYFLKRLQGDNLGYAYFPARSPSEELSVLDGATNRYSTVPGGSLGNYNLGRTATHEIGHWLGLFHTFDQNTCDGPGDLIADTPVQDSYTTGCPIGRDSCPNLPGLDPIHNYMDYSYDSCYEEFTPLQYKRMWDAWFSLRKPRACNADNCLRGLRATTIPGRVDESLAFCAEFTKFLVTDVSLVKDYAVDACKGNVISRVSSACTCLPSATFLPFPKS